MKTNHQRGFVDSRIGACIQVQVAKKFENIHFKEGHKRLRQRTRIILQHKDLNHLEEICFPSLRETTHPRYSGW